MSILIGGLYIGENIKEIQKELGRPEEEYQEKPGIKRYIYDISGTEMTLETVQGIVGVVEYLWSSEVSVEDAKLELERYSDDWLSKEKTLDLELSYWGFSVRGEAVEKYTSKEGSLQAFLQKSASNKARRLIVVSSNHFKRKEELIYLKIKDKTDWAKDCSQQDRLEVGWQVGSREILEIFFQIWRTQSLDKEWISDSMPKIIGDAYMIFWDFYTPQNLKRIYKKEGKQERYSESTYLIVQSELRIAQRKTLNIVEKRSDYHEKYVDPPMLDLTIHNMKVNPQIGSDRYVVLNDIYRDIIWNFLDGDNIDEYQQRGDETNIRQIYERLGYLNEMVEIERGHWGGWYIESHPLVTRIDLNGVGTKAKVQFQLIDEGGIAYYEKREGQWFLKDTMIKWTQ